MILADGSFQLKDIDWTLLGIVSGILLGVILVATIILFVDKAIQKKNNEVNVEVQSGTIASYLKSHLTEIIFATSFVIILVLVFFGKFYISWSYGNDESSTTTLNFFTLIFGGEISIANNSYILSASPLMISAFSLILIGSILTLLFLFVNREKVILSKICNVISSLGIIASLILILFYFQKFFEINDFSSAFVGEFSGWIDTFSYSSFFLIFLIILLGLCNIRRIFNSVRYTTQDICEEGILIALAVVLDNFIKIKIQAGGGSVSLAAVPLFIIAIRHGPYKGFVASAIMFGLITCMIDGYGFQTYPFDYFIGFGGYALVGLFTWLFSFFYKKKEGDPNYKNYEFLYSAIGLTVGCVFAMLVRYVGSTSSSMILYGYSLRDALIYNSTYIPFAMLLDWFVTLLLLKPILMINARFKYRAIQ